MTMIPEWKKLHPELPIFALPYDGKQLIYTPGQICLIADEKLKPLKLSLMENATSAAPLDALAQSFRDKARLTLNRWEKGRSGAFNPICLLIYLSNRCQFNCTYCYASASRRQAANRGPLISLATVTAAARRVAQNCARAGKEFYLVLHGGGEPTLHWTLLQKIIATTRSIADEYNLPWRSYLATHGFLSAARASWLAEHLDSIGLSCDGPPDIQDRQRPHAAGRSVSRTVERTARLFSSYGKLQVRATITPATLTRQREIVAYLHDQLGADRVRLEPVYRVANADARPRETPLWRMEQVEVFRDEFLAAQRLGQEIGCMVEYAGVRLDELHGPHCSVLRQVLHLTPDGTATGCFFSTDGRTAPGSESIMGRMNHERDAFAVDEAASAGHRQRSSRIPDQCRECLNIFHCSRGCPESCYAKSPVDETPGAEWRCRLHQSLTVAWLRAAAAKIERTTNDRSTAIRASAMPERLNLWLAGLKPDLAEPIRKHWQSLQAFTSTPERSLPQPIWARRGFTDDPETTWEQLQERLRSPSPVNAISIYLHIPFCDRKCRFCDCLSQTVVSHREEKEEQLLRRLLTDLEQWTSLPALAGRSVTTIHFGGGTPNYLRPHRFKRVVDSLKACFPENDKTEWALESTSSLLTAAHLHWLQKLGFTRLHVGVQTLQDPIREIIGRRDDAASVLQKLLRSLQLGLIVSVDLIYGLPGQTIEGWIETLRLLADAGIHGFSLYQLQTSRRNQRFIDRHFPKGRDPLFEYLLFQLAEQYLSQRGYRKNHFTHFALPQDRTLYYTHLIRGEDLLALGPTADGVFADYHYRHNETSRYLQDAGSNRPSLQGGLAETADETRTRPLVNALMSGTIREGLLASCRQKALLDRWLETGCLRQSQDPGQYILTANGSWMIQEMIKAAESSLGAD